MSEKDTEQPFSHKAPALNEGHPSNIDYAEERSILALHSPVMREQSEPRDGSEPLSLWLVGFCFVVLFWGGMYLGQYSAGFGSSAFDERVGAPMYLGGTASGMAPSANSALSKADDPIARGKRLFVANCASCHQSTGLGQPGVYPSLHGSNVVNGGGGHLVRLVLFGAQGPWTAKSGQYNNAMTAWGSALNDKQISQILSYIRQDFENSAPPITPEQVAAIREAEKSRRTPWTYDELMATPDELPEPADPNGSSPTSQPARGENPASLESTIVVQADS